MDSLNNDAYTKIFAAKLRYLRTARNMTQDELAEAASCSKASISNYENAKKDPTSSVICRLSKALGVSISELMCEKEIDILKKINSTA